jgi:hypothetical protein
MKPRPARVNERGVTIAFVVLVLIALLGIAALAVDLGVLYTARNSAQNAADSAALAGAYTYVSGASPTITTAERKAKAESAAIEVAKKTAVLGSAITDADVIALATPDDRTVRVTVTKTVGTFFGKVLGMLNSNIQTVATAQASDTATASQCLKPFWIANTAFADEKTYPTPLAACDAGQVLIDSCSKAVNTTFVNSILGQSTDAWGKDVAAGQPSQWGLIKLDGTSVGPVLRCSIAGCLNDCNLSANSYKCGSLVPPNLGLKVGNVSQPAKDLIGQPDQDVWVDFGQYKNPSTGVVSDTSKSLATVVVYDNCPKPKYCGDTIDSGMSGADEVTVVGFGTFFIEQVKGHTIPTRLVSFGDCSNSGGTPEGETATGPFAYPIRLVQNTP